MKQVDANDVRGLLTWLVVALILTISSEVQAYEYKRNDAGEPIKWTSSTIDLCLSESFINQFGEEVAASAAEGAAAAWSGVSGVPAIRILGTTKLDFSDSHLSNCIHWDDSWDSVGNELALTYTLSTSDGNVVAADIVLNAGYRFAQLDSRGELRGNHGKFDLQSVLTHEMGHVLGLAESDDVHEATMYPETAPGEAHKRVLADDDIQGVSALYEGEETQYAQCGYKPGAKSNGLPLGLFSLLLAMLLTARAHSAPGKFQVSVDESSTLVVDVSPKITKFLTAGPVEGTSGHPESWYAACLVERGPDRELEIGYQGELTKMPKAGGKS